MTQILQDILKLSVSERILIVEAIWDSIAEGERGIDLSSETKQIIDERLELHRKNPTEGSSWNDIKARINSQL
ncbi:MAG: addiction module protein [Salinivirgaceae bacterium]|nr:addiction module protein [Salinivirgaceae bacterium]MDD4746608.1 addiction module protein [Salinivirgaceae bacterium]MDY0281191.1 addiction module protein [Salinivirgaceae bacterium]